MSLRSILSAFGVIGIVLLLPAGVRAQEDAGGSNDHPMLSRFPGYYIEEYDPQDFGTYTFQLGDDKEQKIEGRYWKISYWLKDGAKKGGPVELGRNYANLFTQRGGKKLYDTLDAGGGVLTARMPAGGKNIWLEVDVSNSGEVYELTVVEEAAMVQQVEFTAIELARILNEQGSVAVHGILFDTGRATIRDESKGELQSVGDFAEAAAGTPPRNSRAHRQCRYYRIQSAFVGSARGGGEAVPRIEFRCGRRSCTDGRVGRHEAGGR